MANLRFMRMIVLTMLSLVMFSCENELHMTLPQGPEGKSAYDVWVEEVKNGTIAWDKNNIDRNNFFLYLKGEDGAAGKSAYDIWKEEVAKGLDNPHNSGTNWSVNNTTLQDFWYYLTGAKGQNGSNGSNGQDGQDGSTPTIGTNGNWFINGSDTGVPAFGKDGTNGQNGQNGSNGHNGVNGKSAYELWVEEVAKGLDNPHIAGTLWPKDQTTTADFWEYLRGADGSDGKDGADGSPGEIGEAGKDVIIVKGKANVVAQYSAQEFSEYVRWTDGGVAYIVYDDQGNVSPGAKVKGLPGVLDPNKVYIADANGQFVVPKEDLPLDKAVADRFGTTAEVEYLKSTGATVKEVSAPNTYVPSRMQIRIRIFPLSFSENDITLSNDYMVIPVIVERKLDLNSEWKVIPSYLGNLNQRLMQHELKDMNDPTSYDNNYRFYYNIDISTNRYTMSLPRMVKQNEYIKDRYQWDNKDHYFTFVLHSYYGETPHTNCVIKMAPIQYMPLVTNIKAYNYSLTLNVFSTIEGKFDFSTQNIDEDLIFKSDFNKENRTINGNSFDYYYPVKDNLSNYNSNELFSIFFSILGNTADNSKNQASILNPNFIVFVPYINSEVRLKSDSYHFKTIEDAIGNLQFNLGQEGLKIVGTKNGTYNFPDIPVQQIP